MLWVQLFAYFSFSIVSNLQSQHFRIAKITKPKLPQRLCFGMKLFQNRLTEWIKLNAVRFLAELHFWHRALSSSLTWLGPSVFLLPLLRVISWTPQMDLPFHLFPSGPVHWVLILSSRLLPFDLQPLKKKQPKNASQQLFEAHVLPSMSFTYLSSIPLIVVRLWGGLDA